MAMPRMVERWTRKEVLALPDDGLRHELIDGMHIVSPAPRFRHQHFLFAVTALMAPYVKASGVAGMLSLPGDLALGEDEVLQPDLFVWPIGDRPVREWEDITALLLVVEVLSPGTARYDRGLKRRRYQRAQGPRVLDRRPRRTSGRALAPGRRSPRSRRWDALLASDAGVCAPADRPPGPLRRDARHAVEGRRREIRRREDEDALVFSSSRDF